MASGIIHAQHCDAVYGALCSIYGVSICPSLLCQITSIDDAKANAEANGLKSLALDHLGSIISKLKTCSIKAKRGDASVCEVVDSLEEVS